MKTFSKTKEEKKKGILRAKSFPTTHVHTFSRHKKFAFKNFFFLPLPYDMQNGNIKKIL